MAWAHCALSSSSFPPSTFTITATKTLDSPSSLPPLKLTKRKNYLRPKLLKTLNKPNPSPILPQKNTVVEEEQPITKLTETLETQQEDEIEVSSDRNVGEIGSVLTEEEEELTNEEKELALHNYQVSVAGVPEEGMFSKRVVIEMCLYLVAIGVLQTVYAVLTKFGPGNLDKKTGSEGNEVDLGVSGAEMVNGEKKVDLTSFESGNLDKKTGSEGKEIDLGVSGAEMVNGEKKVDLTSFESGNLDKKTGSEGKEIDLGVSGADMANGEKKGGFWFNLMGRFLGKGSESKPNGFGSNDESVLNESIVRIRAMAREAREIEAKKLSENELGSGSDVIEKEVDGRLSRLEKSLRTGWEKSTTLSVNYLHKSSKVEDKKKESKSSNGKVVDEKLVFRKKKKFRNYPGQPENRPKGFPGGKDSDSGELSGTDEEESHLSDDTQKESIPNIQGKEDVDGEMSGKEVVSSFEAVGETSRNENGKPRSGEGSSKVEDRKVSESSSGKAKDEILVLRKKKKLRNNPKHPENPPKGFQGRKGNGVPSTTVIHDGSYASVGNESNVQPLNSDSGEVRGSDEEDSHLSDDTRKGSMPKMQGNADVDMELSGKGASSFQAVGGTPRSENVKPRSGSVKETSKKSIDLRKPRESETNISRPSTKERGSRNNSPRNRGAGIKNDHWWMNLPYVMVIFLRIGPGEEAGLYSLKMDEGSSSYIVAFQDLRDATNFSFILESFYEDLGDVSADVAPVSMEDIKDALKSKKEKIIVVRKGQLNLYAGQPLGDVEMALRSCVD